MKKYKLLMVALLLLSAFRTAAQALPDDGPLTIDSTLQALGERILSNKQGSIVAIEPSTGRILAMVSRDKVKDGINRAVSTAYAPGSTFKTAQALTMLSEDVLTPEKTYPCRKGFYYDKIHIGCHEHPSPLSLVQAIGQSCNSYFCKAFQEMIDNRERYLTKYRAINRWHAYMWSMGLGHPLGVDLPDEACGTIPDSAYLQRIHRGNWNGTTVMWVGMGQGEVQTTPLQLCNLAAMIANRGWYLTPHIHLRQQEQSVGKHVCMARPDAYDTVIAGMRAAVVSGTCAGINTKAYKICGKTGTAENEGEDHSIFMGFAPMENPRIAVSIYVENGGFGADLAAPLASLMFEQYLTGSLSAQSQLRAKRWERRNVKITPVEIPITLDDL